ncbi:MAG: pyridoxamine 5'-phosphate oxidase family protein, partial [Pseudomonadota bacterium]
MAITTEQELRGLYGAVSQRASIKMIDHLDTHCRRFIAASPFMLLTTSNGVSLDVSPKGDPAGCVVIGEGGTEMLLADRPGNNRIDGLLNIVRHP